MRRASVLVSVLAVAFLCAVLALGERGLARAGRRRVGGPPPHRGDDRGPGAVRVASSCRAARRPVGEP